jgi:hypothetical protein
METTKTLPLLETEARAYGLAVAGTGAKGRVLKRDYVKALMACNLVRAYGGAAGIPMAIRYRMSFGSPQLLGNYFDMKPEEQEAVWSGDGKWLVEKVDGLRGTLMCTASGQWSLFPREVDPGTYMWPDLAGRLLPPAPHLRPLGEAGVFDVEIGLAAQGIRQSLGGTGAEADTDFRAMSALVAMGDRDFAEVAAGHGQPLFWFKLLDVYYWGQDLRGKPYREREAVFGAAVAALQAAGLLASRPAICKEPLHKKAFHEGVLKRGGEGTVAVDIESPCVLDGRRDRHSMAKIKKTVFPSLLDPDALTDTVDGWVSKLGDSDPETGLPLSIQVSALDGGREAVVAECEAIPLSIRQSGALELGCVVEIDGDRWKGGRVENARVIRIRADKLPSSCTING